jgi:hypothetical protein
MAHNFFRGTSLEQSGRVGVDAKLKKRLKVAAVCDVKITTGKVKLPVMNSWISQRITDLLGFEDDIVINLVINFLEASDHPDPKQLQLDLTGFLEKQAALFVEELWTLLVDAQGNAHGVPSVFIEKKKEQQQQQQRAGKQVKNDREPLLDTSHAAHHIHDCSLPFESIKHTPESLRVKLCSVTATSNRCGKQHPGARSCGSRCGHVKVSKKRNSSWPHFIQLPCHKSRISCF